MQVSEYAELDATALAEVVRRGEASSEEVHAAAIEAIAAVDGELNAMAAGPWDRPLDHATDGPLAGVPLVLKDLGAHPAGIPRRLGTRLTGDGVVFAGESSLVGRFREAGLAIAGLTTVPELGLNVSCEALAYGRTSNPWDTTRSAGGSSGGSGAIVAAGGVPVAHANDGGGSIRIPAAFNGLVGLKPSYGRISNGPQRQDLAGGVATEGAITRTVRDAAALLDVMAGAMPGDRMIVERPLRPWSHEVGADAGRLRIAMHTTSWSTTATVDPEITAAVEVVARRLQEAGHHVEHATPIRDADALIASTVPLFATMVAETVDDIAAMTGNVPGPELMEAAGLAFYERGKRSTGRDVLVAHQSVNHYARLVGEFFERWDVLLTPTADVVPPRLGELDANDASYDAETWSQRCVGVSSFTPLFNLSGNPAISLPLGWTSGGLPIGIQLAAPTGDEATLIRLGSFLEEAMPWRSRRPSVHAAAPLPHQPAR